LRIPATREVALTSHIQFLIKVEMISDIASNVITRARLVLDPRKTHVRHVALKIFVGLYTIENQD